MQLHICSNLGMLEVDWSQKRSWMIHLSHGLWTTLLSLTYLNLSSLQVGEAFEGILRLRAVRPMNVCPVVCLLSTRPAWPHTKDPRERVVRCRKQVMLLHHIRKDFTRSC